MNSKSFKIGHPSTGTLHNTIIIAIWGLLVCLPLVLNSINNSEDFRFSIHIFHSYAIILTFFLVNRFLVYQLFPKKRYKLYAFLIVLCVIGMTAVIYFLESHAVGGPPAGGRMHDMGPDMFGPPPEEANFNDFAIPPTINLTFLGILIVGLDTLLYLSLRWMKAEQERTKLAKDNMQMQLSFLQQQVSPHLFMNTLNNIHALIDIDTEKAQDAVFQLSQLMSYLIYDSHKTKIKLTDELNFIDNYIELMRLRFPKRVEICWNRPKDFSSGLSIPPLLYISAIENAFKYGVSYQKESFIHINLVLLPNKEAPTSLQLEIKNTDYSQQVNKVDPEKKNNIDKKNGHSGLGLNNMKTRLDLLYPEKYNLKYETQEGIYNFLLTIPLNKQEKNHEKDTLHSN
ncbi:MAG: histidine kinase [Bacteroidaceae bacterium]